MTTISFMDRNTWGTWKKLPEADFQVQRYSNAAMGGPYDAEIKATGSDLQLWTLLDFIGCPVFLTSEQGDYVWWGRVTEVEVIARNPLIPGSMRTRVGASLDTMFNKIAVAWEDIAVGAQAGARYTTAWASDTYSQAAYGVKEGLFSGESASDSTLAEQARDILLSQKKYPIPIIELNIQGESTATIRCRGWWDTLGWRYCTIPTQLALSYAPIITGDANMGTEAREKIAQGILITGGDINLAQVKLYLKKVLAPTDNIQVAIYSNPDDLTPTASLATSTTIAGTTLTTAYVEYTFTFSPEYNLVSGTKYFLVVERSGAAENVNYYQVRDDPAAGYAPGTFVYYDGSDWIADATIDLEWYLFQNALIATSTQVLNILTLYGQFFVRVESKVASGLTSESYRDGDGTALYEAEQLMAHGTTNDRRMLATVDSGRQVLIYEEPASSMATQYLLHSNGKLQDPYGAPVRDELATAGVWARIVDAIPPSVDTTRLGDASVRFIERTEYDAINKRLNYTARDELDPLTVGRPLDG